MATRSPPAKSPAHPLPRRRNSVSTKFSNSSSTIFSSSFKSDDQELLPIKAAAIHSYSSLRDILPSIAAISSPKHKWAESGPDVSIRNRLVKQAARAYLRPMSTSSGSTGGFLHRFWRCVVDAVDCLCRSVVQVVDGTFRLIGLRGSGLQRSNMSLVRLIIE